MDQTRAGTYRRAYEEQLRARVAPGEPVGRTGPVIRRMGAGRGFVLYRDLSSVAAAAMDAFIADQLRHFGGLVREVEWKYHANDLPADLPRRLTAAGFVPSAEETVMVGEIADLTPVTRLPEGVRLREVGRRADLERIRRLEDTVWGCDHGWLVDVLERGLTSAADPVTAIVAEAGADVVCAAWVRFHQGTDFASLWGGATLPAWRGRGIYRATVAHRLRLAAGRGFRYVQVDASAASRPILARLGLVPVVTTTPYVITLPGAEG